MKDANGNSCAPVFGGPWDGIVWCTVNDKPGDILIPLNTTNGRNRPRYRLSDDSKRWDFVGFETNGEHNGKATR